ncbi:MAG: hypothetical protein ACFCVE_14570 [Phycisphaerae bacterium]
MADTDPNAMRNPASAPSNRSDGAFDEDLGPGRAFPGLWVIIIMFAICLAVASLSFLFIQ